MLLSFFLCRALKKGDHVLVKAIFRSADTWTELFFEFSKYFIRRKSTEKQIFDVINVFKWDFHIKASTNDISVGIL